MSPLWAGMQAYLATFARSFKEAQTYMGFLVMAPMLPGLASTIYPFGSETWMYAIPVLGSHLLAADALGGKAPPSWAFLVAASSAAVVSWLLVRLTTRLLQRERIVFSR
jgi:sodium transport system permease protein